MASKEVFIDQLVQAGYIPFALKAHREGTNDSKEPAVNAWQKTPYNPSLQGVSFTGNYGLNLQSDDLIIDADPRNYKPGDDPLKRLFETVGVPTETFVVRSGRGVGKHIYLKKPPDFRITKNLKAYKGLDFLSAGAYVVGPGSLHPATEKPYTPIMGSPDNVAKAPQALLMLIVKPEAPKQAPVEGVEIDDPHNIHRFTQQLIQAEPVEQGNRDNTAYKVACTGRDWGLSAEKITELMCEHWNSKCNPPLPLEQIKEKVSNACRYAKDTPGNKSIQHDLALLAPVRPNIEFPLHTLPRVFQEFSQEASEALACPVEYVACSLLSFSSGLIGTSASIQLKPEWEESCNLYVALVGQPATKKTPAINAVRKLLEEIIACHSEHYKALKVLYEQDFKDYKKALKAWENNEKGKSTGEPLSHSQSPPIEPVMPKQKRILITNATVEALCQLLCENPKGVTILHDELSAWVRGLNEYKGGKGSDKSLYLQAFNGVPHSIDRKNQEPLIIPKPFVNLIGGIQPDVLGEMSGSGLDDGLKERFLYCFPPHKRYEILDKAIPTELKQAVKTLYAALDKRTGGELVKLSVQAKRLFLEAEKATDEKIHEPDFNQSMTAFHQKMLGYIGRFALIFHIIKRVSGEADDPEVQAETLEQARKLSEYFLAQAENIFDHLNQSLDERRVLKVLAWAKRKGLSEIKTRDLTRNGVLPDCKKASDARRLFRLMADYGHGEIQNKSVFIIYNTEAHPTTRQKEEED